MRFVGYVMSSFQRFSLDNSMIKKLYTVDDNQDGDGKGKKEKKVPEMTIEDDNNNSRYMDKSQGDDQSEFFINQ